MSGAEAGLRRRSGLVTGLLLAAVLLPSAVAGTAIWTQTGADLDTARSERAGVAVLRPLLDLVVATADAQSAAVRGTRVDTGAVRSAMSRTDAAVAGPGGPLRVGSRWSAVRSRLDAALASTDGDARAYTTWSQVADLELSLAGSLGEAAGLASDPVPATRRLADAAVAALPALAVDSGRVSDLVLLLEQRRVPQTADSVAAAVLGDRVRSAAGSAVEDLRTGFDDATGRPLPAATLRRIDAVAFAAARLAPPLGDIGATPVQRSASDVESARRQVREAVAQAGAVVLPALDDALADRAADRWTTRWLTVAAMMGGLALALAAAWVAARPRPFGSGRSRPAGTPAAGTDDGTDDGTDGGTDGGTATGAADAPGTPGPPAAPSGDRELLDARELLEARRLVRAGRRTVAQRPAPDAVPPTGSGSGSDGAPSPGSDGAPSPGSDGAPSPGRRPGRNGRGRG